MWSLYAHVPVTVILPLYDRAAMEIQQWNVSGSYIFIYCQARGKFIYCQTGGKLIGTKENAL